MPTDYRVIVIRVLTFTTGQLAKIADGAVDVQVIYCCQGMNFFIHVFIPVSFIRRLDTRLFW